MNILTGVLAKERVSTKDNLDIVWTNCDDQYFTSFIEKLGHRLIYFENLYFGNSKPQLIICNNKLSSYQMVEMVSLQYHIPVLVIDHKPKDNFLDLEKTRIVDNFKSCYRVALSQKIYDSWGSIHDIILPYDRNDENNNKTWDHIIRQTSERFFIL